MSWGRRFFGDANLRNLVGLLVLTSTITLLGQWKAVSIVERERERRMVDVLRKERELEAELGIPYSLMTKYASVDEMRNKLLGED